MIKGRLFALVMIIGGVTFLFGAAEAMSAESPLIDGEGVQIVNAQCGACHSLALVAQTAPIAQGGARLFGGCKTSTDFGPWANLRRLFLITLRLTMPPPRLADGVHSRQR